MTVTWMSLKILNFIAVYPLDPSTQCNLFFRYKVCVKLIPFQLEISPTWMGVTLFHHYKKDNAEMFLALLCKPQFWLMNLERER